MTKNKHRQQSSLAIASSKNTTKFVPATPIQLNHIRALQGTLSSLTRQSYEPYSYAAALLLYVSALPELFYGYNVLLRYINSHSFLQIMEREHTAELVHLLKANPSLQLPPNEAAILDRNLKRFFLAADCSFSFSNDSAVFYDAMPKGLDYLGKYNLVQESIIACMKAFGGSSKIVFAITSKLHQVLIGRLLDFAIYSIAPLPKLIITDPICALRNAQRVGLHTVNHHEFNTSRTEAEQIIHSLTAEITKLNKEIDRFDFLATLLSKFLFPAAIICQLLGIRVGEDITAVIIGLMSILGNSLYKQYKANKAAAELDSKLTAISELSNQIFGKYLASAATSIKGKYLESSYLMLNFQDTAGLKAKEICYIIKGLLLNKGVIIADFTGTSFSVAVHNLHTNVNREEVSSLKNMIEQNVDGYQKYKQLNIQLKQIAEILGGQCIPKLTIDKKPQLKYRLNVNGINESIIEAIKKIGTFKQKDHVLIITGSVPLSEDSFINLIRNIQSQQANVVATAVVSQSSSSNQTNEGKAVKIHRHHASSKNTTDKKEETATSTAAIAKQIAVNRYEAKHFNHPLLKKLPPDTKLFPIHWKSAPAGKNFSVLALNPQLVEREFPRAYKRIVDIQERGTQGGKGREGFVRTSEEVKDQENKAFIASAKGKTPKGEHGKIRFFSQKIKVESPDNSGKINVFVIRGVQNTK